MPGFSKKKGSFTTRPEDLDTLDATGLARPSLTTFCRLDELGMIVAGQRRNPERAMVACRVADDDGGVTGAAVKDHRGTA